MSVGIRTENLSKTYTSPPPVAAAGVRGAGYGMIGFRRKKHTMRVVALDGISLEVKAGEIFGLLRSQNAVHR